MSRKSKSKSVHDQEGGERAESGEGEESEEAESEDGTEAESMEEDEEAELNDGYAFRQGGVPIRSYEFQQKGGATKSEKAYCNLESFKIKIWSKYST